jgi:hypothetical protein
VQEFYKQSILDAKIAYRLHQKEGMPYTWRSILKGIYLLKKGLIWRISDGSNIEIWSDPWLPRDGPRTPVTRGMNIIRHVDELIDPISGNWGMQLVKDIFCEEDARTILALPVLEGKHNKLAWHFDTKEALLQNTFLVLVNNLFLVSAVLADTIYTIRKMNDFLYRLF